MQANEVHWRLVHAQLRGIVKPPDSFCLGQTVAPLPWIDCACADLRSRLETATQAAANVPPPLRNAEAASILASTAFEENGFLCLCPWTGLSVRAHGSIAFTSGKWKTPTYALVFRSTEIFYLLVRGFNIGKIIGLYLPSLGGCFSVESDVTERMVQDVAFEFRDFCLQNLTDFIIYNESETIKPPAMAVSTSHFAHNVWNELSFVEANVGIIPRSAVLMLRAQPNGPIDALFPELAGLEIINIPLTCHFHDFCVAGLRRKLFMIPVGRQFVDASLIQRMLRVASILYPEEVNTARAVRSKSDIVLWITVRAVDRAWTNIVEGVARLVGELLTQFRTPTVILDGITPGHGLAQHEMTLLSEEKLVDEILAVIPAAVTVISTTGASLLQAYIWTQIADVYVSHHGTLQHKVGWLTRIPGIVHCPATLGFRSENFSALLASEITYRCPKYLYGHITGDNTSAADPRRDLFDYNIDIDDLLIVWRTLAAEVRLSQPSTEAETDVMATGKKRSVHFLSDRRSRQKYAGMSMQEAIKAWRQREIGRATSLMGTALESTPQSQDIWSRVCVAFLISYVERFVSGSDDQSRRDELLQAIVAIDPTNVWARSQMTSP